jgi:hypothetical protein
MGKYDAYPQVARTRGKAAQHPAMDCREQKWDNPNTSSAMYGVTSGRYDALALRSPGAADRRKARERAWVERSFRTTGNFVVETRKGGRF